MLFSSACRASWPRTEIIFQEPQFGGIPSNGFIACAPSPGPLAVTHQRYSRALRPARWADHGPGDALQEDALGVLLLQAVDFGAVVEDRNALTQRKSLHDDKSGSDASPRSRASETHLQLRPPSPALSRK